MTLLSVCIPTWNAAPRLGRTLETLLRQDGPDLEVHVCDDASEDATVALARGFADHRVHVHEHDRRLGLAGNWNRALALATGDLVALFGQDDTVEAGWAAALTDLLASHPDAALAFGRRAFVFDDDESRRVLGPFFDERYPAMLAPFYARIGEVIPPAVMLEEAMRHCFEINLIGEPSFVVMRRDHPAVRAGFDPALGQMIDWEFWTRFFADRPIAHTPRILGAYRLHARGASAANVPLSKHYRELDHLIGVVLQRFATILDGDQRAALDARRDEARRLRAEWADREARGGVAGMDPR